jgi:hypothetical protein
VQVFQLLCSDTISLAAFIVFDRGEGGGGGGEFNPLAGVSAKKKECATGPQELRQCKWKKTSRACCTLGLARAPWKHEKRAFFYFMLKLGMMYNICVLNEGTMKNATTKSLNEKCYTSNSSSFAGQRTQRVPQKSGRNVKVLFLRCFILNVGIEQGKVEKGYKEGGSNSIKKCEKGSITSTNDTHLVIGERRQKFM